MSRCFVMYQGTYVEAMAMDGWWRCMKCRRGRILRSDATCRVCHCRTVFEDQKQREVKP